MENAVKTRPRALKSSEIAIHKDAKGLKLQELSLKQNLKEFMLAGNASGVVETQRQLAELPLQIRACEIRELKDSLDDIQIQLLQLKRDEQELEAILRDRSAEVASAIVALQEKQVEARKVSASLFSCDTNRQILLDKRRELNKELENYINEVTDNGFE